MRKILATDLGIWPLFNDIHKVSDAMLASKETRRILANYILIYDQIFIPTGNLQILPVLRIIFGEDIFDELIKNNVIVLARYDKWFAYGGNGSGLTFFSVHPNTKNKLNLCSSFFYPLDECINTALSITNPLAGVLRKNEITKLLLDKVVPIQSDKDPKTFIDETYKDILQSIYLRKLLAFRNSGRSLNKLKGIKPNEVKTFTPHIIDGTIKDHEIRAVLQVAFENFILGIASDLETNEIAGDQHSFELLKAKGQRMGMPIEGDRAFTQLQEISGVPDIGSAFAENIISPEQLLDIRESKHAQSFRDWMANAKPDETSKDIVQKYVGTLGSKSIIESIPVKTLRFAATLGLSSIEPITGVVVSAIDNFVLSKWFPVKSPRLFLKQAKSIVIKTQENNKIKPAKAIMSGRDRNKPCPCGSGKKFKKCCGK